MMRRAFAWVMLVLFILLLINILIFRVYMTESVMLYGLMVVLFFFTRLFKRDNDYNDRNNGEGEPDADEGESESEQGTEENNKMENDEGNQR